MKQSLEDILRTMKTIPEAAPRATFQENARIRLMNTAFIGRRASILERIHLTYHIARLVGGFALASVFVGGAVVYAAQYSKPGNPLYPIKTASEQAALHLAPTTGLKTSVATILIDRRVQEVTDGRDDRTSEDVERAVSSFNDTVHSMEQAKGVDASEVETHAKAAEKTLESFRQSTQHGGTDTKSDDGKNHEEGRQSGDRHPTPEITPHPTIELQHVDLSATPPADVKGIQIEIPRSGDQKGETSRDE